MYNNDDNGAYQTEGYQSSAEKKAKKPFLVRPSQYAACILLADGSLIDTAITPVPYTNNKVVTLADHCKELQQVIYHVR